MDEDWDAECASSTTADADNFITNSENFSSNNFNRSVSDDHFGGFKESNDSSNVAFEKKRTIGRGRGMLPSNTGGYGPQKSFGDENEHNARNCPGGDQGNFIGKNMNFGGYNTNSRRGYDRRSNGDRGSGNDGGGFRKKGYFKSGEEGHMRRDSSNNDVGNDADSFGKRGGFGSRNDKAGRFGNRSGYDSGGSRNRGDYQNRGKNYKDDFGTRNNDDSSNYDYGGYNFGDNDSDGFKTRDHQKSRNNHYENNDSGGYGYGSNNSGGFTKKDSGGFSTNNNFHYGNSNGFGEGNNSKSDGYTQRGGHKRGGDRGQNSSNANDDGVKRENYIPPEPTENEDEMFESLQRGINFSKYDSIPVEVSGSHPPPPINSFMEAELTETIQKNVARARYDKPTPVQKYSIPIINSGRDLMACAQTGSGKTAAFLLPAISAMIRSGLQSSSYSDKQMPQAIIVGPTRELVNQIFMEARKFAHGSICRACVAYGGTSVGYQLSNIRRGCNILIATPGRLNDFINRGTIGLDHVQFFILDEADRMLDMGFEGEIRKISTSGMPSKMDRQTLMFSATFPDEIQKLAHDFLKEDFIFLTVGRVGGACSDVTQDIIQIDQNDKREKLLELLADVSQTRARTLVFVETKRSADFLACSLSQSGYPTTSIHGDRLQREREEALRDFKKGDCPILIATSVAARGLDIPKVEHVINYDLPKDIDEYVHRIGRTGRCGNLGRATSFYDDSKDREMARCLTRVLAEALQNVPAWLEGCAEHAIGTDFGTERTAFRSRDTRTKGNRRGGGVGGGSQDYNQSSFGSRATGDYDYNDGGGFDNFGTDQRSGGGSYNTGGRGGSNYSTGNRGGTTYNTGGRGKATFNTGGRGKTTYNSGGRGGMTYNSGNRAETTYSSGGGFDNSVAFEEETWD